MAATASSSVGTVDEEALPPKERTGLAAVGGAALDLVDAGKQLYSVFVKTLYYTVRGVREPGAVSRQMYEIGNKSLIFLCVVMGFIGMILVYQAGLQTRRVVPDLSLLGATFLELLVRDLAAGLPTIEAYPSELNQVWTHLIDNALIEDEPTGRASHPFS